MNYRFGYEHDGFWNMYTQGKDIERFWSTVKTVVVRYAPESTSFWQFSFVLNSNSISDPKLIVELVFEIYSGIRKN